MTRSRGRRVGIPLPHHGREEKARVVVAVAPTTATAVTAVVGPGCLVARGAHGGLCSAARRGFAEDRTGGVGGAGTAGWRQRENRPMGGILRVSVTAMQVRSG